MKGNVKNILSCDFACSVAYTDFLYWSRCHCEMVGQRINSIELISCCCGSPLHAVAFSEIYVLIVFCTVMHRLQSDCGWDSGNDDIYVDIVRSKWFKHVVVIYVHT